MGTAAPAVRSSTARLYAVKNSVELALDRADEDICPYVFVGHMTL
jgi:hypothetical protein